MHFGLKPVTRVLEGNEGCMQHAYGGNACCNTLCMECSIIRCKSRRRPLNLMHLVSILPPAKVWRPNSNGFCDQINSYRT